MNDDRFVATKVGQFCLELTKDYLIVMFKDTAIAENFYQSLKNNGLNRQKKLGLNFSFIKKRNSLFQYWSSLICCWKSKS